MENKRLDEILVYQSLAESKSQARLLIIEGKVTTEAGVPLLKPGKKFPLDTALTVTQPNPFVSRGGLKLDAFLIKFNISVSGKTALDVGASTGGFTDCLLQREARSVTCLDVGHNQLHSKIQADERIINLEGFNAKEITAETLPYPEYDIIVMDLSFISIKQVLPAVWAILKRGGILISLIKPQFEATRQEASKGKGIIRNSAIHNRILEEIKNFSHEFLEGPEIIGPIDSPIKGGEGNVEFLMGLKK